MKLKLFLVLLFLATLTLPATSFSQSQRSQRTEPLGFQPLQNDPPIQTPFDGGLSIILLAAGAGYAVKKSREYRKRKKTE